MADTIDLQACERCSKEFPIETMRMMEDCWFCAGCTADFDKAFAACEHQWEPHVDQMGDAGQYCTRCTGFVRNEDMHLLKPRAIQREALRPMSDAPRDGSLIRVRRVRKIPHPKFKQEVRARWRSSVYGGQAWTTPDVTGVYMRDEDLEGWWPA